MSDTPLTANERDWRAGCECNRVGLCLRCQAAEEIYRLNLQVLALTNANKSLADRADGQPPNRHTTPEPAPASKDLAWDLITRIKADIIANCFENREWSAETEDHCATLDLLSEALEALKAARVENGGIRTALELAREMIRIKSTHPNCVPCPICEE